MLEELRRYNTIGDIPGIAYFSKQVLGDSKVQKSSIQKLCSLQNDIRLNFGAAVAFFKYLGLVNEQAGYLYATENASFISDAPNHDKALCMFLLKKIIQDGLLDVEAVHFNIERKEFVIERYGFSVSAAIFRNILIQYRVLKEVKGDLVLNPDYENIFSDYKRKEGIKKSLETLKKQLEQQEIQGDKAEIFVMEYERKRIHSDINGLDPKRISLIDVAAGYDILSYDGETSVEYDRFIEVKSFVGNPHFYWSQNEIETAKLYEDHYYVYLVDATRVGDSEYEPTIIVNPARNVLQSDRWILNPTSYLVIPTE